MLDKNAIGRSSPPTLNEVEKGAIRRLAEALGDYNPIYYDEEYARASGYPTIVAPPTFPASFHSAADLRELLGWASRASSTPSRLSSTSVPSSPMIASTCPPAWLTCWSAPARPGRGWTWR